MNSDDVLGAFLMLLGFTMPLSIAASNLALAGLTAGLFWAGWQRRLSWRSDWNPPLLALLAYAAVGFLTSLTGIQPARSLHEAAKDLHKIWTLAVLLLAFSAAPKTKVSARLAAGLLSANFVAISLWALTRGWLFWQNGWGTGLLELLALMACAAAVCMWVARQDTPNLLAPAPLAAGFAIAASVGVWQTATQHFGAVWMRAHSFMHPVSFGEMLAGFFLGALCFWGRIETAMASTTAKRWVAALLALTGTALVLNQTRAALLGLVVGFAAACRFDRQFRRWALPAAGLTLATLIAWELMPTGGRSFHLLLHAARGPGGSLDPSLARVELWIVALRIFKDHPFFGVGPGNYNTAFPLYFQGSLDSQSSWGSSHNLYLQQLAERGLVGLTALVAALAALTGRAYTRARRNPSAWNLWAWGAWAAFLVMNLTEVAFQNELVTTFFLFIWAWSEAHKDAPAGQESHE
jgi:hypothetical protein